MFLSRMPFSTQTFHGRKDSETEERGKRRRWAVGRFFSSSTDLSNNFQPRVREDFLELPEKSERQQRAVGRGDETPPG